MKKDYTEKEQAVVILIVIIFIVRLFVRDLFGLNKPKPVVSNTAQPISTSAPTSIPSISPSPTQVSTPTPTPAPTQIPTATPQPTYDKSFGNNYLAAQVAQNFYQKMNSSNSSKGFITDIYIALAPEEVTSPEDDYLNSISSIFIQVSVDNSTWNSWDENSRKDIVVMMMNAIQKSFPKGMPHITVRNGVRVVAEGSISFWGNEPTVTLK